MDQIVIKYHNDSQHLTSFVSFWFSFMSKHTSHLFALLLSIISLGSMERANADSSITQDPLMKSEQAIMRICYEDKNNFPFITKESISDSKTLGLHGTLTDLIIASAHTSNLSIQLVRLPWKRCIQHLAQGKIDAIFAAIWTQERETWGVFPKLNGSINLDQRLWRARYRVFIHKHSNLKWSNGQFSGLKLGVAAPLGYIAHDKLSKLGTLPANNLTPNEGFTLLVRGRLDGYVIEKYIGQNIINQLKLTDELTTLKEDFMHVNLYMPVSHQWYQQHSELTLKFWQTLAEVREEQGDTIFNSYIDP
ncbi:ABC-type amino acid transport/signal transduction system, periplasmic component/domain [Shewanella benthica KT99]|uniref:ABC-type amino acid transport/signal transduction system, periplasmic component/domain n=2 Tax=Shewanella benthica TaxID=43661 RepID=A9D9T6_9GAMM|nr:ABC-type amino acid transport/signal transduction system, periplasmic component/domain [Shewanella benthica KT99]